LERIRQPQIKGLKGIKHFNQPHAYGTRRRNTQNLVTAKVTDQWLAQRWLVMGQVLLGDEAMVLAHGGDNGLRHATRIKALRPPMGDCLKRSSQFRLLENFARLVQASIPEENAA